MLNYFCLTSDKDKSSCVKLFSRNKFMLIYCIFNYTFIRGQLVVWRIVMGAFRIVLQVIFILICIALTVLVLMQEGKSAGLGAISGAAETYWGKNKGRSMEGKLVKITKYLAIGFMVLTVILNLNVF